MHVGGDLLHHHGHLAGHGQHARVDLVRLILLVHGGPLSAWVGLGGRPTPTERQASGGGPHLKFHERRDNLLDRRQAVGNRDPPAVCRRSAPLTEVARGDGTGKTERTKLAMLPVTSEFGDRAYTSRHRQIRCHRSLQQSRRHGEVWPATPPPIASGSPYPNCVQGSPRRTFTPVRVPAASRPSRTFACTVDLKLVWLVRSTSERM